MARIRSIKPEFPQSESMGRVSREARLCYILLWTISDDEGRLRGNSRMLASLLYPYDDDAPGLIGRWLDELEGESCITRYVVEGATYLEIAKWLSHQKIDKPSRSKIPAQTGDSRGFARIREDSTTDLGSRIIGSRIKEVDLREECLVETFDTHETPCVADAPPPPIDPIVTTVPSEPIADDRPADDAEPADVIPVADTIPAAEAATPAKPARRGTRLPDDWRLPMAWGAWALSENPQWTEAKVRLEAEKFRDYWVAKPGKGATKLDWEATWRSWCRSDIAHRDRPGAGTRAGPVDTEARNAEAMRLLGIHHHDLETIDA